MKILPGSIKWKIAIFILLIGIAEGLVVAYMTYKEEVESAIERTRERIQTALAFTKAARGYVRGVLRPRIDELISKYSCIQEDFILEAQSSSFFAGNIFRAVGEEMPDFRLRQVAFSPLNPKNTPNAMEKRIIEYFRKTKAESYEGIETLNNQRFFVKASPVKVKAKCLRCHSTLNVMPVSVRNIYKPSQDPQWKVGSIQGGIFVYVPFETTLIKAQMNGIIKGLIAFVVNILIVGIILILLNKYVFKPVEVLREHADKISRGEIDEEIPIQSEDEIGQLGKAFERMRVSIKKVMDLLK
jgi:HAMP domain-containing protein